LEQPGPNFDPGRIAWAGGEAECHVAHPVGRAEREPHEVGVRFATVGGIVLIAWAERETCGVGQPDHQRYDRARGGVEGVVRDGGANREREFEARGEPGGRRGFQPGVDRTRASTILQEEDVALGRPHAEGGLGRGGGGGDRGQDEDNEAKLVAHGALLPVRYIPSESGFQGTFTRVTRMVSPKHFFSLTVHHIIFLYTCQVFLAMLSK